MAAAPRRLYFATAQAFDTEMTERIALHRARRDESWQTVDVPLKLARAIGEHGNDDDSHRCAILVDCLTLWVTNLMLGGHDIEAACDDLIQALGDAATPIVLVANEVGLGIVPENKMAREFRDHAGRVNQRIAAHVAKVHFVAAGLPMILKG